MVIIITYQERDRKSGNTETLVSHGYDTAKGESVLLPPVSPGEIGHFDNTIGEWVLTD